MGAFLKLSVNSTQILAYDWLVQDINKLILQQNFKYL